ncbi:MAG: uridine kinase [Gammaproteobacteria bacterium]|jgi:uridine kinase|nr:uridine kinase [Gammaproteobacteria bacterium]
MHNEASSKLIIIGIAGASGSGKSLLSKTIVNELGSDRVVVISEDSYYKDLSGMTLAQRAKVNFDHPDAFDHTLLAQHLNDLKEHKSIDIPVYDFVTHARTDKTIHIDSHKSIVVLEGILLFVDPAVRKMMDICIYVDTPLDVAFIRRLRRDVVDRGRSMESVIEQYQSTVRPMFVKYVDPSKRHADLIIPHGGKNRIAIDMVQAKMKELLNGHLQHQ